MFLTLTILGIAKKGQKTGFLGGVPKRPKKAKNDPKKTPLVRGSCSITPRNVLIKNPPPPPFWTPPKTPILGSQNHPPGVTIRSGDDPSIGPSRPQVELNIKKKYFFFKMKLYFYFFIKIFFYFILFFFFLTIEVSEFLIKFGTILSKSRTSQKGGKMTLFWGVQNLAPNPSFLGFWPLDPGGG